MMAACLLAKKKVKITRGKHNASPKNNDDNYENYLVISFTGL